MNDINTTPGERHVTGMEASQSQFLLLHVNFIGDTDPNGNEDTIAALLTPSTRLVDGSLHMLESTNVETISISSHNFASEHKIKESYQTTQKQKLQS